jgi:hypothetical protein
MAFIQNGTLERKILNFKARRIIITYEMENGFSFQRVVRNFPLLFMKTESVKDSLS